MKKVLIVDDDRMVLNILGNTLKKRYRDQFEVLTADNGKKAIKFLTETPVSLLVSDLVMPGINGFALLSYVNEHHLTTICFVMTAHSTPEILECLPPDVVRLFQKPVSAAQIGPAILNALQQVDGSKKVYGISVVSFLLMVELEKRTCLFEVTLSNGEKGLIYFKKGVLYNAKYGNLKGEEAVVAVIAQGQAKFHFRDLPSQNVPRAIFKRLEQLIMETKRQQPVRSSGTQLPPFKKRTEPPPTKQVNSSVSQLNLCGIIKPPRSNNGYEVTVSNLSKHEIEFKQLGKFVFRSGQQFLIEFRLDDKMQSAIKKSITIKTIRGPVIIAEFNLKNHYDRLGTYLAFNGFVNETISSH